MGSSHDLYLSCCISKDEYEMMFSRLVGIKTFMFVQPEDRGGLKPQLNMLRQTVKNITSIVDVRQISQAAIDFNNLCLFACVLSQKPQVGKFTIMTYLHYGCWCK